MIFEASIYVFLWYNPGHISVKLAVYISIEYTSIKEREAASFFLPNVIQQNNKILQPDFLLHHLKIISMLNENLFRYKWALKT